MLKIEKIKGMLLRKNFRSNIKENKINRNKYFKRKIYNTVKVIIAMVIITSAVFLINVTAELVDSENTKPANPEIKVTNNLKEDESATLTADVNISKLIYTTMHDDYRMIDQNSRFTLYCNIKIGSFIVENRETGYLWRSIVDYPEDYALNNLSTYWKSYISSLIIVNYTDLMKNEGLIEKAFSSTDAYITNSTNIKNGISLDYDFSKLGISLNIEIILNEDSLVITIPSNKIKENKNFGIVNIELAPFFGAESDNIDGYIFYPDGSGAIMKYENSKERPTKFINLYKGFVFSPEKVDISEYISAERNQKYNAMLPVYGVKNGENAFLAIAAKGAEETAINICPYGYAINLNRANFVFNYRHFYNIILSNITLRGSDIARNLSGTRADKELIIQEHEVKIVFLDKSDANYSGMANAYRDYLMKNNELKKVIRNTDSIPLEISLFMGIKEERMLFDKYIPMTSFQQAGMIAKKFKDNGIDDLQLRLIGWSKGGYGMYPDVWPPERKLGGISEMKKLLDYALKNNIQILLQTDSINAVEDSAAFSKRNDVVIQGNDLPVTNINKDRFILNPFAYFKRMEELINKISMYDDIGLALEKVGKMLYHDYNKSNPSSRAQTVKTWEDIFHLAEERKKPVGVEGGNVYALKYADYLFNIPERSSGYHIADETVPFFQMVVHGMIPYTTEPGNLAYDLSIRKLQWIEYGCMPLFELTYEDTISLKYTEYNKLFNSQYEHWIGTAVDIYKEFNDRLQEVWDAEMIKHEKLSSDLVKVSYSNGVVIYINYSDKETVCNGYKIKAQDYIVIDRKGAVR